MIRVALVWFGLGLLASTGLVSADEALIPKPEHPRPDARRPFWANLNGRWQFRFDANNQGIRESWEKPDAVGYDRTIVVPFPWESELSGIHEVKDAPKVGWYRRRFAIPKNFPAGQRVWLRFDAVDWHADVWVNGRKVAEHEGGYTPFEADISDALTPAAENVLVVRAFDPTDPNLPTGKQIGWYTELWHLADCLARGEAEDLYRRVPRGHHHPAGFRQIHRGRGRIRQCDVSARPGKRPTEHRPRLGHV